MEFKYVIQTVIEIIIAAALIYGLFGEDKWAAFERKFFRKIKYFVLNLFHISPSYTKNAEIIPFNQFEAKRHCH